MVKLRIGGKIRICGDTFRPKSMSPSKPLMDVIRELHEHIEVHELPRPLIAAGQFRAEGFARSVYKDGTVVISYRVSFGGKLVSNFNIVGNFHAITPVMETPWPSDRQLRAHGMKIFLDDTAAHHLIRDMVVFG